MYKVINEYGTTMRIDEFEIEEFLEFNLSSCIDWEEMFDEFLDMSYKPAEVCGCTYYPSEVLKDCDPTSYRCYLQDWISDYICNLADEVRFLGSGETFEIENLTFEPLEYDELVGA